MRKTQVTPGRVSPRVARARHSSLAAVLVCLMSLALGGCQTTTQRLDRPTVRVSSGAQQVVEPDHSINSAPNDRAVGENPVDTDSCAARLHDISGQLLMYYALNGHLPAQLNDLSSVASDGTTDYTCPLSHQPYLYSQTGLITDQDPRRIVVWDAAPVHNGSRWIVLFTPPANSKPASTTVTELSEQMMRAYSPAPPARLDRRGVNNQ